MSKVLVAYFSASGITEKLAKKLADGIGADLFEIVPKQRYTSADLDWNNAKSRSSVEMNDKMCRPAIADVLENTDEYTTVFVGFPVWWYREPSIIDTFMESYHFAGKTVVPFATSGMSPIGDAGKYMQTIAPKAKVVKGKRFDIGTSVEKLADWAKAWI